MKAATGVSDLPKICGKKNKYNMLTEYAVLSHLILNRVGYLPADGVFLDFIIEELPGNPKGSGSFGDIPPVLKQCIFNNFFFMG